MKWAKILKRHDLIYMPQKAVKGQALVDFLADHSIPDEWELYDDLPGEDVFFVYILLPWEMYFDGVARNDGLVPVECLSPLKSMSSPIYSC